MFYIPGTQGRLFKVETDNYIRCSSGKRLKYIFNSDEEEKILKQDDIKELIFVNFYPEGMEMHNTNKPIFELIYPEDRKVYLIEME